MKMDRGRAKKVINGHEHSCISMGLYTCSTDDDSLTADVSIEGLLKCSSVAYPETKSLVHRYRAMLVVQPTNSEPRNKRHVQLNKHAIYLSRDLGAAFSDIPGSAVSLGWTKDTKPVHSTGHGQIVRLRSSCPIYISPPGH